MSLPKLKDEHPEAQSLEKIALDDLAKSRLTSRINDALNDGLKIIVGITYKDEHIGLKADRTGLKISSKIKWRGLGVIILAIGGYLASLI